MKNSHLTALNRTLSLLKDPLMNTWVSGIPSINCWFSSKGEIININKTIEKHFPLKQVQFIGKDWFSFFCEKERTDEVKALFPIEANCFTQDIELSCPWIKDEIKVFSWRFIKNNEDGEENAFYMAVGIDVSQRSAVSRENTRLEALLIENQKMEAIGTLAGGIAHDFNNILASSIGYTELCLDDAPEDSVLYRNLQQVLISGLRAKELVNQILCFSRQSDHTYKEVKVCLIIKEVFKLLRSTLPSTIKITQNIKSKASVWCEPVQIHQIFTNLCTNAAHAMHPKGGALTVDLTDVELDLAFTTKFRGVKPGKFIKLKVMDTGQGIQPDVLSRIFEPYFTTKAQGEGSGLGLAVVHGIVSRLKGFIIPFSVPGEGTSFDIYLPVVKEQQEVKEPKKVICPTGHEKVLVVDDELPIVELLKVLLGQMGYSATGVTHSPDALEIYKKADPPFDLVISDMTMPDMVGTELARHILNFNAAAKIIICTGFSELLTEEEEIKEIKAIIHKPILKAEIAKVVRDVLDNK